MIKLLFPRFWHRLGLLFLALAAMLPLRVMAAIDAPVSPNAQPSVAQLLDFLGSINGTYVLAGQQEIDWDPTRKNEDFDYILKVTGKTPAVRGFDYLQYTYSATTRAHQDVTARALAWARAGGIVACCCHFYVDIGSPPNSPQYFAPNANPGAVGTTFDIRQAVIPGTLENTEILTKLDFLAAEFARLRDAGVVVLWRPFHEAGGTTFWWNAYGPTPYKQLWRIMFDRFTKTHGLTNLVWVFASSASDTATLQNWYPGDDVVDVIGYDSYVNAGTHPDFSADYQRMVAFKAGRKVVTLSRDSALPDPAALFANGGGWSYFATWWGYDDNNVGDGLTYNTADFLNTVYHHAKVITLDRLPSFYVANAWAITTQPQPQQVVAGVPLTLSVAASGPAPLTYQWFKDGTALPGATSAAYPVASATAADAGAYSVTVTSAAGTLTSVPATVTVANSDTGQLVNLSVRATAGTGEQVLIVGFVMSSDSTPKPYLLRALGPALTTQGVTDALADPIITLNLSPPLSNDNWGSNSATSVDTFKATFARLGAASLVSTDSKDAALLVSLPGGLYTATVAGTNSSTGEALAEIYDGAASTGARLVNVSARGPVTTTAGFTAGFVIANDSRTVLIRGVGGLALENQGVNASLPNPTLTLYRLDPTTGSSSVIATNDDWSNGAVALSTLQSTFAHVGAFALDPWSHDAVLLLTLPSGIYTAWVNTADPNSGIALLEVYEVR